MQNGFVKAAAATPPLRVADPTYNALRVVELTRQAAEKGASIIVFPELCLTGYTCGDLFLQKILQEKALEALCAVRDATANWNIITIVGLPLAQHGKLYNCAAILCGGSVQGIVPKQNIPNYGEFYEQRYFVSGKNVLPEQIFISSPAGDISTMFGGCLTFSTPGGFTLGVEICEDLWAPVAPSVQLAERGANVIVNLSASNEMVGKAAYRRDLVKSQSARLLCGYIYADAGFGESTQDLVFSGHNIIAENGSLLQESKQFSSGIIYADIDIDRVNHERRRMNTFSGCEASYEIELPLQPIENDLADRIFSPTPFVPDDPTQRGERCEEILSMQVAGLATRLQCTNAKTAVVGLSGGLDSTLAFLVLVRAFDQLGLARKGILAVTMPCFGTTSRTKGNAEKLAEAYGVTLRTVDIKAAVDQHFQDIGQDKKDLSVTFENAQARMRTLVLMDIANQNGGMVIGTGDLSELALGWATYNGDHMSMYGVNASIPKTLVRYLVAYEASRADAALSSVLRDILETPVSPELLPPTDGEISQKTEDLVGPYELHDFFLYYFLRFGYPPRKIYQIAVSTFEDRYAPTVIKKWLLVFLRRFFSQQFKRSCLPDGPKVGSVTLSPRGDWRMPSDACAHIWLDEAERL